MTLPEARRRAGYSQASLDRAASLPPGTIAAIEDGRFKGLDRATAARIAGALCIELPLIEELRRATAALLAPSTAE